MVFFVCEVCNETLKRNQVDKHRYQCRYCESVTCVDCSMTFFGEDYMQHTVCISEAEKYEKSLYKGKKAKQSPQDIWVATLEKATSDLTRAPPELHQHLSRLNQQSNVPRNKKKFINFAKNSLKLFSDQVLEKLWVYLDTFRTKSDAEVGPAKATDSEQSSQAEAAGSKPEEGGVGSELTNGKKNSKATNEQDTQHETEGQAGSEEVSEKKKSKKRKKKSKSAAADANSDAEALAKTSKEDNCIDEEKLTESKIKRRKKKKSDSTKSEATQSADGVDGIGAVEGKDAEAVAATSSEAAAEVKKKKKSKKRKRGGADGSADTTEMQGDDHGEVNAGEVNYKDENCISASKKKRKNKNREKEMAA